METTHYLHLAAVVGDDEADQYGRGQTDDRLERQ